MGIRKNANQTEHLENERIQTDWHLELAYMPYLNFTGTERHWQGEVYVRIPQHRSWPFQRKLNKVPVSKHMHVDILTTLENNYPLLS